MGAKTKIEQAPTLTPQQKALMDSMMRGAADQMQGFIFGQGWGGPSFESYNPGVGYGGKAWDTRTDAQKSGGSGPLGMGGLPGISNQALQSMSPIASAPGASPQGGGGFVNPYASFSNRDNIVNPLVNPFRRNLGG